MAAQEKPKNKNPQVCFQHFSQLRKLGTGEKWLLSVLSLFLFPTLRHDVRGGVSPTKPDAPFFVQICLIVVLGEAERRRRRDVLYVPIPGIVFIVVG